MPMSKTKDAKKAWKDMKSDADEDTEKERKHIDPD